MIDKSHCCLNMEDEEEYIDFYDFSKTYENHALLIKEGEDNENNGIQAIKEEGEKEDAKSDEESWDDCELNDADLESGDEAIPDEKTDSFEVINKMEQTKSVVEKSNVEEPKEPESSEGFNVDSIKAAKAEKVSTHKRQTKEEAFLGLKIKKAKLLPSGEVQLGNGKVMGHR